MATRDQAKGKPQRQAEAEVGSGVSRLDMEEALVELHRYTTAQALTVHRWLSELAIKVGAEVLFKRHQDKFLFLPGERLGWWLMVDSTGRGISLVWRRQFQQLNHVSLEVASATEDAYPLPTTAAKGIQEGALLSRKARGC